MREEGVVVEACGDRARIRVERSSACNHCSARTLCRPFGEAYNVMEVANPAAATKGQRVVVAVEPARLMKNSLVVYGIPIVALIAGASLGGYVWRLRDETDVGALIGAAVFLGLALVVMRVLDRVAARKVENLPRIIEVLEEQKEQDSAGGHDASHNNPGRQGSIYGRGGSCCGDVGTDTG